MAGEDVPFMEAKTNAFHFLAVESEKIEYQQAVEGLGLLLAQRMLPRPIPKQGVKAVVKLKRTFTMAGIRFWRVDSPGHPNHDSDLSIEGLRDWGIIK